MAHIQVGLDKAIPWMANNSYALLTEEPVATRAAIFIHGFWGHPFATWARVQDFIATDDRWKGTDAYFLGYDTVRDDIMLSARCLERAICTIFPQPPEALLKHRLPTRTQYEQLVFVAHSLGGIVLRTALLELIKKDDAIRRSTATGSPPTEYARACDAEVVLFAPAQGGIRLAGLKGLARHTLGLRALVDMFSGLSPSLQEMEPGSPTLQALREYTDYYADRYPDLQGMRARIVWAHRDTVVVSLPFRHDISHVLRFTDHSDVCKPYRGFEAPFSFINGDVLDLEDGAL